MTEPQGTDGSWGSEESYRAVAGVFSAVLGQQDLHGTLEEICRITVLAIPRAAGCSLTSFVEGAASVVAASDPWARELDELQYEEREGPCLDATRTGTVYRLRDLEQETRWPFYVPRAVACGVRSMMSLPMSGEGRTLGALNVYARQADAFSADQVALGQILAAQAGVATQVASSYFRHRDLAENLRVAMASRAVIEQAKGVLIRDRRIDADAAFAVLVELSQTTNRKLRDVAQLVVAQAARPD